MNAVSKRQIAWLPLGLMTLLIISLRHLLAPWIFMWSLSISIWFGFKWITWWQTRMEMKVSDREWVLAYIFLWPGMDAQAFLSPRTEPKQFAWNIWALAISKMIFGVFLFWGCARLIPSRHPLVIGWTGLFGLIFILHFGIFHLISLFWQTVGVNAKPIMRNPIASTSLNDFWSNRWNLAFRQLAHSLAFHPLHKQMGANGAMFVAFLASGLIHDVVISLPAQGGYGLPTLYFVLQATGLAVQRSTFIRKFKLDHGFFGWLFTLAVAGGPAFWLFHPLFIVRVVLPFMQAMKAL